MALIGGFVGFSSFYYISRHHEMNRLRQLKFSVDLLFQLTGRAAVAGVVGDLVGRKMFVNYNKIQ